MAAAVDCIRGKTKAPGGTRQEKMDTRWLCTGGGFWEGRDKMGMNWGKGSTENWNEEG